MADNQENDLHFPRIYTLHSQKGGVGKTSIALAIAGFAAFHNDKMTLIIDADFTGTSFLDIPDMIKVDKKEYFNDFILAKPSEFEKYTPITSGKTNEKIKETRKKFCWNVPDGDGKIFYMPGSALVKDMKKIIPLISQEDHLRFFRHRLEDILVTATMAGFEVIIIDHSPGLLGLSKSSLFMVVDQAISHFNDERHPHGPTRLDRLYRATAIEADNTSISAYAIFVTTFEPVDYRALFPSISYFLDEKGVFKSSQYFYGHLDMIFNEAPGQPFDSTFEIPEVFEKIRSLPDDRNVHNNLIDYFDDRAKEVGAGAAEYIKDFDMARILGIIKNLKAKEKPEYAKWENWCMHVSKTVRLPVELREKQLHVMSRP
ncbi:MAG: AAA family ATPase [Thermodesulfobacteriota bacterium]|nr:AAA family ATPase [Thermodesulfobacteriota bacterium]